MACERGPTAPSTISASRLHPQIRRGHSMGDRHRATCKPCGLSHLASPDHSSRNSHTLNEKSGDWSQRKHARLEPEHISAKTPVEMKNLAAIYDRSQSIL